MFHLYISIYTFHTLLLVNLHVAYIFLWHSVARPPIPIWENIVYYASDSYVFSTQHPYLLQLFSPKNNQKKAPLILIKLHFWMGLGVPVIPSPFGAKIKATLPLLVPFWVALWHGLVACWWKHCWGALGWRSVESWRGELFGIVVVAFWMFDDVWWWWWWWWCIPVLWKSRTTTKARTTTTSTSWSL